MGKKKVRVNLIVDLEVDEDLDVKEVIAVGKYEDYVGEYEAIHLKTDDFEVLDYVDIKVEGIE